MADLDTGAETADVVVVGSANVDLSIAVPRTPRPGETVLGDDAVEGPGGKGLNQAVAAARLGRRVHLVGAVGADPAGDTLLSVLADEGVTARLSRLSGVPTGRALVITDDEGESTIVVSPGANGRVDAAAVEPHAELLGSAAALLLQHEIPDSGIAAAVRLAKRAAGPASLVVLNPAPARPITADVLARVDVLTPNRHELGVLVEGPTPGDVEQVTTAARQLLERVASVRASRGMAAGRPAVVVTVGGDGAVVVEGHRVSPIPAVPTEVVDTTAAGDTFCAALVDGLLAGADLVEATRWACAAAAVTVRRPGAARSLPRRDEVQSSR